MIIGIDASRANRSHKSGTEWYSYYLIRELARLDKTNEYILYTDQPLTDGLADLTLPDGQCLNKEPEFEGGGWQKIISPGQNFRAKILNWPWSFFWTQGRLSWEMLWHAPDVLFIPAHALPIIHPKKSVVTLHDMGFARRNALYERELIKQNNRWLNPLIKLITRNKYGANSYDYLCWSTEFAVHKAQKIITISNFSKLDIIDLYHPRLNKVEVVYNGYNNHLYQPATADERLAVRKKYNLHAPYIFYVGRLERKKNIANLIEAFAIIKTRQPNFSHQLCLAGDASYGYDEIKYLMQEFGLEQRVVLPGWVPETDLPALFSAAAVFVFPSKYEGFGIPLLQAMSCGAPIAASEVASIPEVAGEAAVYFDPDDVYRMALVIEKILLDQSLSDNLVAAGLARARQFSWERCGRETLKVLENL